MNCWPSGHQCNHVSVYRWVKRFTPLLIDAARPCRRAPGDRWFVDESMSKAPGDGVYLCRAIDRFGQVLTSFLRRDGILRPLTGSSSVRSSEMRPQNWVLRPHGRQYLLDT
jgi:hypothetical protein